MKHNNYWPYEPTTAPETQPFIWIPYPYGDGTSSNKIIKIIKQKMNDLICFSN